MSRCIGIAVLAATLVSCGPGPKFAGLEMGPRPTKLSERILEGQLANGMRVVLVPDSRTNLVTVGVNYSVGAGDDPAGDGGLAHYVEHVMFDAAFKGADDLRSAPLEQNALTAFDRTFFYASALDVDLDRLLDVAARRFEAKCTDLDPAALARERDVVIEEIKYRDPAPVRAILAGIFGPDHPYATFGSGTFADVSRDDLCAFIDRHYGPASAVLVVTGNVRAEDYQRIRSRFERIPPRDTDERVAMPALPSATTRVVVPGLERPTAMIVFPVPGEGSDDDAAIELANGMLWGLPDEGLAFTRVVGEGRARAIVVSASTEQATDLDDLEQKLRDGLRHGTFEDLAQRKEHARVEMLSTADDLLGAGFDLAALSARHQRPTRFRGLAQLEAVTAKQLARLFDLSKSHTAYLLPEIGARANSDVDELVTSLHQLDVARAPARDLAALPAMTPFRSVVDYKLANGLRVLLAPDPDSIGVDARLVISGAEGDVLERLPTQAALLLSDESGAYDGVDANDRVRWYMRSIGAAVSPRFVDDTTVFRIAGLGTFADWHVWHLAWRVVHGRYPSSCKNNLLCPTDNHARKRDQPSARAVAARRLAGIADAAPLTVYSSERLDAYRQATYRPDASTLVVAGRFDPDAMRKEIDSLFGAWRGPTKAPAPAMHSIAISPSYISVPVEDAHTVSLAISFARSGPVVAKDRIARDVLVEMINARLEIVREGLGATYGIYAAVDDGSIRIAGDLEPAYADKAAKAVAAAISDVRDGSAALAQDFARARATVLMRALARPVGATRRANALERIAIDGLSAGELDRLPEQIRALDLATVQRLAARDLAPERQITAARGRRDGAHTALLALGATPSTIETFSRTAPIKPAKPDAPRMQTASATPLAADK